MKSNAIRQKIHTIIFEADTKAGKLFDVILLVAIFISVLAVLLESVPSYKAKHGDLFYYIEWVLTIFFTTEYFLRIYAIRSPIKYITSFFGIVDLLSILPSYLSIFMSGSSHSLAVIRALRLLRVFRIFKLGQFLHSSNIILSSLRKSIPKIGVFLAFILILVTILGSVIYLIETDNNAGFDSIPRSIYWAIVTLTTVGYGDITPNTTFGQFIAAFIMLLGYAVIAVPTGIVSADFATDALSKEEISTQACQFCGVEGHDLDASYCNHCGQELHPE